MTETASPASPDVTDAELAELVGAVLGSSPIMYLSTSMNDQPWVAGCFFAEDDPFTLRLILELSGTTLRNIETNPDVAVVVSSGNPFEAFLQGKGRVELVADDDPDGEAAVKAALRAKSPQVEPLLLVPVRSLVIRISTWRLTDIPKGWLPGKVLAAPS